MGRERPRTFETVCVRLKLPPRFAFVRHRFSTWASLRGETMRTVTRRFASASGTNDGKKVYLVHRLQPSWEANERHSNKMANLTEEDERCGVW